MIGPPDQQDAPPPTPAEIREQVRIICGSQLRGAKKRRAMLLYILEATLDGNAATERSIAIEVYGKIPQVFDPACDTIVRAEISATRKALADFYQANAAAPVEVSIISGYRILCRHTPHYLNTRRDSMGRSEIKSPEQANWLRDLEWVGIGFVTLALLVVVPPFGLAFFVVAAVFQMLRKR